ncbi:MULTISPECIES: helix-turn-helix transcriptional regulator [unclassified Streptomyces]|uniref:helix-turn-helix domain-containing protein n=1 Tax=unclassified Streptomyces TaxID=2593676 RepID=UPI002258F104|nr:MULTISPECIES: helix-turn-helix transcriptional regulator [unclassified Streptomyces]MCX4645216.1 helix-turn-helix transcriptional regulator [Streptomyces sp. NBC_01446]MCX5326016.1 helix-turn-helix transcriptional regulator [Streptomyces sp. NBC_00120]
MPKSPSSSAQAAREAVALKLRDMRLGAGLTVQGLASAGGWHHSKTSRIENAKTAPSARDIRAWCEACGMPEQAAGLIAQSLDAEAMYREWRLQVRSGMRHLQDSVVDFFRATRLFRVYSSTLVPGLLQTEGYAAALLTSIADFRQVPVNDGPAAAAARVERSRIILEPGHRFLLLVEEAVLRAQIGDEQAMAAQLGYLLTAGALPQVSLGVIPADTSNRCHWPIETFHVYDDRLVSVELTSAEVNITEPAEIALYLQAFEQLRSMAVYGADARALITRAIDALDQDQT